MSLQVWLPLDGNLHNQGLNNTTIINNGTTFETGGKIGQCCNIPSGKYLGLDAANKNNNKYPYISIACWVYPTQGDSTERAVICCYENGGAGINLRNTKLGGQIYVGGYTSCYTPTTITLNTWQHICMTYDGTKLKVYLNGELVNSAAKTGPITYHNTCPWEIGGNPSATAFGSGNFIGKINDVRIYDHALSAKEVKEIAQGLVLHYKLDNIYSVNSLTVPSNLYTNGDQQKGYLTSTQWTRTKLSGQDGYNYKLAKAGNSSGSWPNGSLGTFTFTAGKTYWYSCKIRCNAWSSGELRLRAARTSNDFHPGLRSVVVCNNELADGEWHEYCVSQVLPANFKKSDGTSVTTAPKLEFFSSNQSDPNTTYTMNFDLKELRVIESDFYIPSNGQSLVSNIEYDCSGYGHNATIIGDITKTADTPRFNASAHFSAKSQHIQVTNLSTTGFGDSYSICWWGKINTFSDKMFWGFSDGIRLNGIYNGNLWNTGDTTQNPLYRPGTTTQVTAPSVNVWHHFAMVGNGTACLVYLDGVLWGQAKTYKSISGTTIILNGWLNATTYATDNMSISDFRIYATALTTEQVKDLYNTSAAIDKNGNGYAREEIEEFNLNITKTGQFYNNELIDDDTNTTASITKTEKQLKVNTFYEY